MLRVGGLVLGERVQGQGALGQPVLEEGVHDAAVALAWLVPHDTQGPRGHEELARRVVAKGLVRVAEDEVVLHGLLEDELLGLVAVLEAREVRGPEHAARDAAPQVVVLVAVVVDARLEVEERHHALGGAEEGAVHQKMENEWLVAEHDLAEAYARLAMAYARLVVGATQKMTSRAADDLSLEADELFAQRKYQEAQDRYEAARALIKVVDPARDTQNLTISIAMCSHKLGRNDECVRMCSELATGRAHQPELAMYVRGLALQELGNLSEALDDFAQAFDKRAERWWGLPRALGMRDLEQRALEQVKARDDLAQRALEQVKGEGKGEEE